jgi:hypothetical protein
MYLSIESDKLSGFLKLHYKNGACITAVLFPLLIPEPD